MAGYSSSPWLAAHARILNFVPDARPSEFSYVNRSESVREPSEAFASPGTLLGSIASKLNGLDDIGLTLEKAPSIDRFEKATAESRPWA